MQLEEQGLVDLDAPANDYLRAYRLIPADPSWRPVTLRHLLTHTAGIREVLHPWGMIGPFRRDGEGRTAGCRRWPSTTGPGCRSAPSRHQFRYTDHGFATLGQLVEDVTGQLFDRYLRAHVFAPLGMADTDLVRSDAARSRLATGYRLRAGGPRPYPDYEVVTAGGTAAYSTPRTWAATSRHSSTAGPTSTARCSSPRPWP